jgi:hypothetical protein
MLYIIFDELKLTLKIENARDIAEKDNVAFSPIVVHVPGSFFISVPNGFFTTPLISETNKQLRKQFESTPDTGSAFRSVINVSVHSTELGERYHRTIDPEKLQNIIDIALIDNTIEEPVAVNNRRIQNVCQYATFQTINEACPPENMIFGYATQAIGAPELMFMTFSRKDLENFINQSRLPILDSVHAYKNWKWYNTKDPKALVRFLLYFLSQKCKLEDFSLLDTNGFKLDFTAVNHQIEAELEGHEIITTSFVEDVEVAESKEDEESVKVEKPLSENNDFKNKVQKAYAACLVGKYESFKAQCLSMHEDHQRLLNATLEKIQSLRLPNAKLTANFKKFSTDFLNEAAEQKVALKI